MSKLFNWFFGSFFRTAGRFLFYILLFLLLSFIIYSRNANAQSYPYVAFDTRLYYGGTEFTYTSNFPIYVFAGNNNGYFNQVNSSVNMQFEPRLMGGGNYLVDAYIIADPIATLSCADIDTNFHYFDEVSQRWFTSSNEIKSECVDIYQTKFNSAGNSISAHRILMKFWINSESVDSGTVVKTLKMYVFGNFNIINNASKTYFGYSVNSITDYSDAAVNTFANTRQQDQIINQNTTIINQNQTQINQNQTIIDQNNATNNKLDGLNNSLTSTEGADLGALQNSAGWLPAGPVDSILNLPLSLLNNLTTNLNKSCSPLVVPIPFVNKNLIIPCLNTIYESIDGLNVWITTISIIASGFILYSYFLKLYKWVEDTLMFNDSNGLSSWGGV